MCRNEGQRHQRFVGHTVIGGEHFRTARLGWIDPCTASLLQLQHIDASLARRAAVAERYRRGLNGLPGLRCLRLPAVAKHNHAYFPVLVGDAFHVDRDALYEHLKRHGVLTRRYFFALITEFPMYREYATQSAEQLPVAHAIAGRILCLPIHAALPLEQVDRIVELIAAV